MKIEIAEILFREFMIALNTLLGLYLSLDYVSIASVSINISVTLAIAIQKTTNLLKQSTLSRLYFLLFNFRIVIMTLQCSFHFHSIQAGLLLIHILDEKDDNIKLGILVNIGLQSLISKQVDCFSEFPYNGLYFFNSIFILLTLWKKLINQQGKSSSDNELPALPQKLTQEAPPTFQAKSVKSQEFKSIKQVEESKSPIEDNNALSSSDIRQFQLNSNHQIINDDDLIVTKMSWLSNQSVLIYNMFLNIVYQTFYLGKLQKNVGDKIDCENIFLDSLIIDACKEIHEVLGQSGYSDSIFSDGSFLCNNLNEVRKCKIQGQYTLRDLVTVLQKDFEKWKFFTLTIFKLKNEFLEMEGIQIKLFLCQQEDRKFTLFCFEQVIIPSKSQSQEVQLSLFNIYHTFIHESVNFVNCILTYILLLTHNFGHQNAGGSANNSNFTSNNNLQNSYVEAQKEYATNCLLIMRYYSQRYTFFLNSMKDYIFYFSNQLFFKMGAVRIDDLLDDLLQIFEPTLQLKEIRLTTNIELQEGNTFIFSDQERIKQVISFLLSYCIASSSKSNIRLEVKSYTLQGIMITIKDNKIDFDEQTKQKILNLTKTLNQQLKSQKSLYELDLTQPLELQICIILCWQFSGTFKRGLEFLIDNQGFCTFTFVIESQNTQIKSGQNTEAGPIKVLGQKKYFETSLSLLLQDNVNSNPQQESRFLSFTQLSRQFSVKPSDPIDLQSAYLSQISKIRQETSNSKPFVNSGTIHKQSREQSGSFSGTVKLQTDSIQQLLIKNNLSMAGKLESPVQSQQTYPAIDFGSEIPNNFSTLPDFQPKLLNQVIKYKLRANCCSKVLLLDNDPFSIIVLQKVLLKYDIKCDYSFNGQEGLDLISKKAKQRCHCGNRFYLLYFIELNMPIISGSQFVYKIKNMMKEGEIDKGFSIATATVVDLNSKLECFQNGMDYFISKPFDLIEISAAVQYLDF